MKKYIQAGLYISILAAVLFVVIVKNTRHPSPVVEQFISTNFADFNRSFSSSSGLTDMQKDNLFDEKFKGRLVKWSGRVMEVSKSALGGVYVLVKHTGESIISDVTLDLKPEEESRALQLRRGQTITYSGRIESWGSLTDHRVDEGVILEAR